MRRQRRGTAAQLRRELDALWSEAVRSKGFCEVCGRSDDLQAHHIVPRTVARLRHDLRNGACLCRRHHLYWAHKDVLAFAQWCIENRAEDVEYLSRARQESVRYGVTDLREQRDALRQAA